MTPLDPYIERSVCSGLTTMSSAAQPKEQRAETYFRRRRREQMERESRPEGEQQSECTPPHPEGCHGDENHCTR